MHPILAKLFFALALIIDFGYEEVTSLNKSLIWSSVTSMIVGSMITRYLKGKNQPLSAFWIFYSVLLGLTLNLLHWNISSF